MNLANNASVWLLISMPALPDVFSNLQSSMMDVIVLLVSPKLTVKFV